MVVLGLGGGLWLVVWLVSDFRKARQSCRICTTELNLPKVINVKIELIHSFFLALFEIIGIYWIYSCVITITVPLLFREASIVSIFL